jgi:type VI secretion system secreted protein VgrG
MDAFLKAGMNIGVQSGMGIHVKAGGNLVLEGLGQHDAEMRRLIHQPNAGGHLHLRCAAGEHQHRQCAPVPGSGCSPKAPASPASPEEPEEAQVADDDRAGKIAKPKKAEKPPKPLEYGPQAVTLRGGGLGRCGLQGVRGGGRGWWWR